MTLPGCQSGCCVFLNVHYDGPQPLLEQQPGNVWCSMPRKSRACQMLEVGELSAVNSELLYLRPNVQVEPLFGQWYLWPHLISPATAARNVTERHLRIMDSYISAPMLHANAVRNPKMLGGPFIDYGGKRVEEIKELHQRTKERMAPLLSLSAAISELDELLKATARGFSLQPTYSMVPEALRGYVELSYDLNNQASFRLLEPLLYRSKYYDRSTQSLMLSLATGDDRPFVLSTPRLEDNQSVHLHVAYDDEIVDRLFRLKVHPGQWMDVLAMFDRRGGSEETLRAFFTAQPPRPYEQYTGKGVRWRYFGHACILIESSGRSILFDPILSYTYETGISRYTYEDLPSLIDYVVITHNHQDHILFETLLQLRRRIKQIVVPRNGVGALQDPSIKLMLKAMGFHNVIELSELEELEFDGGRILGLPFLGEHSDLSVQTKLMYLVNIGKHSLMFAADSCNVEPKIYEHVHQYTGDIDALFLGMECDGAPLSWLYGPLLTQRISRAMDESRRLAGSNYDQGIDMVDRFGSKEVYVYAMGQEPWLRYISSIKYTPESRPIIESSKLIKACLDRGLLAERLFGEKEILLS
jgi:L-ascorbate metabolism protein UlaG (beta-lactamase superfamily)